MESTHTRLAQLSDFPSTMKCQQLPGCLRVILEFGVIGVGRLGPATVTTATSLVLLWFQSTLQLHCTLFSDFPAHGNVYFTLIPVGLVLSGFVHVAAPGGMPLMSLYTSLCVFILCVLSGLHVYSTGDV